MAETTNPQASSKAGVFAKRTGSTLFLWALVSGVFISFNSWAYLGLIGLLAMIAAVEYFTIAGKAGLACFPRFGIALALAYFLTLAVFLSAGNMPPPEIDAFFVALATTGAFTLQLRHPIRGTQPLVAVATHVLGFIYIPVLFSFAARIIFMVPGGLETAGAVTKPGAFLLLWLVAVTKFTDMGAYITGSLIGKHKMIPHVSPGKTWEGIAGGIAFAQLGACGLYALFTDQLSFLQSYGHVVTLGFILATLAVIGDLAESIVKRSLDAKDSGNMLPGIGGALDLIDSICFTAPALFFYLKWILLPAA
ncbi:MAG: phosphatidate cytidylyltransferase [Verrucomicrobiales bacterium]|nr:CDP-archaeol synthase [Verrucomicrobiota bacterium JB025]